MKTTLCTLYNSLYLDKGLVLYDSLKECAKDFELYVLCMDEKCYEVLSDIDQDRLKPIHLYEVENEKMLKAKSNRSIAEYCWTCSSRLIQFIFETYKPTCCTYIDADMYFYKDPQILVKEMQDSGKSVMMVPHRFSERNEAEAKIVGTYCVEFNTFLNDEAGNLVLTYWHNKCLECCSNLGDGVHWGDQKYMDEWPKLFPDNVHVCKNPGAGIAPWNIDRYRDYNKSVKTIVYNDKRETLPVVFFHFQSLIYKTRYLIYTGIPSCLEEIDYKSVDALYCDYLYKIDKKKLMLKDRYNLSIYIKKHPSTSEKTYKKILDIIPKIYNKIVGMFKSPTFSYSVDIRDCSIGNSE